MNRRALLLAVVFLVSPIPAARLSAQAPTETPGLRLNGIELTIGGRVQTQFNTTSVTSQPPSQLFFRRARLEVSVQVDERVSGTIQPDFAGDEVEIKDAYLNFALTPGLEILAGRAYRPFGLLEQTSSKRIVPIERGLRIRGLAAMDEYAVLSGLRYSNRDIGIQIHGDPEGAPAELSYAAGVLRGPLHGGVGDQDSYQFAARATMRPHDALRVGAGWSNRDFARPGAGVGDIQLRRGNAFEMDVEYGSFEPGFHLLAELSRGDFDPFDEAGFWGAHAWLAYRTETVEGVEVRLEPLLRVSYADVDAHTGPGVAPGGTLLTPGLNVYLSPLNRIMINYDLWLSDGTSPNARSLKAMFQFAF
ncbi:MAG: porin [Gemmatimonadota bacterium]